MSDVTRILSAIEQGDPQAAARLLPLVYDQLRRLAAKQMACEEPGHTLDATALVHEAWLRLVPDANPQSIWQNRRHFFAAAAEAMRRILVESARRKHAVKHGGRRERADVDLAAWPAAERPDEVVAVSAALDALALHDAEAAELVKLRYFVGMTLPEAAKVLGISTRTAERQWTFARTWLRRAIEAP